MLFSIRNFALVLASVSAVVATEQIRLDSMWSFRTVLFGERSRTHESREYHPASGFKIICETDADTSDGFDARDPGKWINLISCYDGKVEHPPTNGHYPLPEIAEDWGAPWECGHGKIEDKFEVCDSFYITFVGELYADATNCDAKVFYFTCLEEPAPTPKPVPAPTPKPAPAPTPKPVKRCPDPEHVFHPVGKCKSSGKGDKIEWDTKVKDDCLPSDYKVQIYIPCSGKSYSFDKSDHKKWDCEKGKIEIHDETIQRELVACKDKQAFHLNFLDGNDCPSVSSKCRYTPIALDLDRSGAVERMVGNFEIDITGDGEYEELSQWFAPTEGILVDVSLQSADGSISGVQLFGDEGGNYADGFEKLATHDDDGNGIVEGKELDGMAIWVDANSNAKLDVGELSALKDHKIVGLMTSNDNLVSYAILEDGSEMVMEDLFFFR